MTKTLQSKEGRGDWDNMANRAKDGQCHFLYLSADFSKYMNVTQIYSIIKV